MVVEDRNEQLSAQIRQINWNLYKQILTVNMQNLWARDNILGELKPSGFCFTFEQASAASS